jgi:xylose isomerase
MRHFDAHAYRTEDAEGVWDFARGCMRTYLVLKEKAERMRDDAEIQEALAVAGAGQLAEPTGSLAEVRAAAPDEERLAARGYGHERLDQLVTDLLLGTR